MVAIVLGILKIIGILLLIILGLILFVLFSVLLVPVRYRAEGSIYEHLKGSASASWFMRLISIKVSYDGEAQMDFRIPVVSSGQRKRWGGRKCSGTGTGGAGGNRGSEAGTGENRADGTCRNV